MRLSPLWLIPCVLQARDAGPEVFQGTYRWSYKAFKQEGMGTLQVRIESERFTAEVRVAGILVATIDGTASEGYRVQTEEGTPPKIYSTLSELPLILPLPVDRAQDLIPILEGRSPLLRVESRDAQGPKTFYYESKDAQGHRIKLWLTRQ